MFHKKAIKNSETHKITPRLVSVCLGQFHLTMEELLIRNRAVSIHWQKNLTIAIQSFKAKNITSQEPASAIIQFAEHV